jgi:chromosome segregation ATPase
MKKVLFALLLVPIVACNMGPSKSELKLKTDSLYMAAAEKDRQLNEFVNALVEIDQNLAQIKEKENLITLNANEAQNSEKIQDQINRDIKMIYDLMVQNQEKISQLEKQLRSSNNENANMKKLIASLNEQLKEKTAEIMLLNEQLKEKDYKIADLNFSVLGLNQSLDSLKTVQTNTSQKLNETTTELYSAFYAIGTSKELKDQNIINKEGFLNTRTKVLTEDVNKSYFTKVDTREIERIPLMKKKVKLLSSHPDGSYVLENASDDTKILVIKDKNTFWSVSKYLIVQVS